MEVILSAGVSPAMRRQGEITVFRRRHGGAANLARCHAYATIENGIMAGDRKRGAPPGRPKDRIGGAGEGGVPDRRDGAPYRFRQA